MTDLNLIRIGSIFKAADSDSEEAAKSIQQGVPHKCKVSSIRNLAHHRKFFALLNLSFEYWQPKTFATDIELATIEKFSEYMKRFVSDSGAIDNLASEFVSELNRKRCTVSLAKSKEQFRAFVTVQAGFYEDVHTPAGPKRIPKSISFARMSQTEFNDLYRQALNVCWQLCLHECFSNQDELAAALLEFE